MSPQRGYKQCSRACVPSSDALRSSVTSSLSAQSRTSTCSALFQRCKLFGTHVFSDVVHVFSYTLSVQGDLHCNRVNIGGMYNMQDARSAQTCPGHFASTSPK